MSNWLLDCFVVEVPDVYEIERDNDNVLCSHSLETFRSSRDVFI